MYYNIVVSDIVKMALLLGFLEIDEWRRAIVFRTQSDIHSTKG
jgi:hypothetical protein